MGLTAMCKLLFHVCNTPIQIPVKFMSVQSPVSRLKPYRYGDRKYSTDVYTYSKPYMLLIVYPTLRAIPIVLDRSFESYAINPNLTLMYICRNPYPLPLQNLGSVVCFQ